MRQPRPQLSHPTTPPRPRSQDFAKSPCILKMELERAFKAALDIKAPWKSRVNAEDDAVSVVQKSDDYDDGNWHAKQPEQDRAAHKRLLFSFRYRIVAPIKRASILSFLDNSHQASNARLVSERQKRRFSPSPMKLKAIAYIPSMTVIERRTAGRRSAPCLQSAQQFGLLRRELSVRENAPRL